MSSTKTTGKSSSKSKSSGTAKAKTTPKTTDTATPKTTGGTVVHSPDQLPGSCFRIEVGSNGERNSVNTCTHSSKVDDLEVFRTGQTIILRRGRDTVEFRSNRVPRGLLKFLGVTGS